MLTDPQLQQIMPNLPQAKRQLYLPALNQAMAACGVNTLLRTAAFAAQLAHESGEFRWMEEIWGPTAAQLGYEPPAPKAARLGNTQPGDGKRFKGRGPIQITGRFNYQKYGGLLGVDLTASPERAAAPDLAFLTAGLFWKTNGLNELADAQQFVAITRRINGGENGLADRQKYYARAQAVLQASGFVADAVTRSAAGRARSLLIPSGTAPLPRGNEGDAAPAAEKSVKKAATKVAVKVATKVPAKRVAAKKATAKKAVSKKVVTKTVVAKTASAKKTIAKSVAAKKATAGKATTKKATAKTAPARKTPA